VKIGADLCAVRCFNEDCFEQNVKLHKGEVRSETRSLLPRQNILGISSIQLDEERERVNLVLSAKVLKGSYYDLINRNNVDELVRCINDTGCIILEANAFLDSAEVYRFDTTTNLPVPEPVGKYIEALQVYAINGKYECSPFDEDGIVFVRKVKSYKERDIFYDKFHEMERHDKKHLDLLNWQRFFGNLRVEANHTDLKHIRERCGVDEEKPKLLSVLESSKPVNLNMFDRIIRPDDMELRKDVYEFESLEAMKGTPAQIGRRIGMREIIEKCGRNMFLIRKFLREKSKGNPSRMIKLYGQELIAMNKETNNVYELESTGKMKEYIFTIRELLKVA